MHLTERKDLNKLVGRKYLFARKLEERSLFLLPVMKTDFEPPERRSFWLDWEESAVVRTGPFGDVETTVRDGPGRRFPSQC